jgi:arylformamidase
MDRGDGANVSKISMGTHTGTHMDAPIHFLKQREGIDKLPMSVAMGRARVIQIEDKKSIKPDELVRQRVRGGERILFRTRNSNEQWQNDSFIEDFVYVSSEAAKYLAKLGVLMVGIDYLSVGGYRDDGAAVHRFLLEAGIWIVEGLDLSKVVEGHYEMICLPLKIAGGDGAPARVLLKPVDLSSSRKDERK